MLDEKWTVVVICSFSIGDVMLSFLILDTLEMGDVVDSYKNKHKDINSASRHRF